MGKYYQNTTIRTVLALICCALWGSAFALNGEFLILLCSFAYGTSSVTMKMISDRETPVTITDFQLLSTIAFSLWAELLKYNPVGKVTVFGFSIPVFGVALSALLLKEQILSVQNLIALVLVSMGIIVVNRPQKEWAEED